MEAGARRRPRGNRRMSDRHTTPRTLLDIFFERVRVAPDAEAMRWVDADGVVHALTWGAWDQRARALAAGLLELGLAPGARVVVLSRTRVEWALIDVAVLMAGGISVPIFPNELPTSCGRVLRDSGARVAIAENPWQLNKLREADPELIDGLALILIDEEMTLASGAVMTAAEFGVSPHRVQTLAGLEARGAARRAQRGERELAARIAATEPDGCATICYTPGTEGAEKGVMLTHENFAFTCHAVDQLLDLSPEDTQLLYLPLAQAFARLVLWVAVRAGAVTAFARSYRTVFEDAGLFQPTYLAGVPRLFEKTHEEVEAELLAAGGWTSLVAGWVVGVHSRETPATEGFVARAKRELGGRVVRRRLRERFGGKLRFAFSGGAPLGVETARFFHGHGLPLLEGYGMVETCAATHLNRLGDCGVGTVGRPLPGVEFKLLEDGELCVRGRNVTPGYWNKREETDKVFDADGWFHTGDLGEVDDDGRLVITDRKRDIIVTANGKAIAPRPIAEKLRVDPLVGQVLIHGDRRTFLTALISLRREPLLRFAEEHGLEGDYETLTRHPRVFAAVDLVIDRVNATLAPHEVIRKFAILQSEPTTEAGDLTPTMRLKRRVAAEKYKALLDSFYSEPF
ncbi:MAG: long-chain fatty acid--CoA ligase [Deltaproteobacteria bacterium]|nr:MAG: long-chain fatty acid--CoA ligase [Deltaproteobacteria bacterium]